MQIDPKLVSDIIAKRRNSSSEADIIREENKKQLRNTLSENQRQKKAEFDNEKSKTASELIKETNERLEKAKQADELRKDEE